MGFVRFVWMFANAPFRLRRFETDLYRDPATNEMRLTKTDYVMEAPDVILVLFMFVFACVYYGLLSLPVTWLMSSQITLKYWPAIIVLAVKGVMYDEVEKPEVFIKRSNIIVLED